MRSRGPCGGSDVVCLLCLLLVVLVLFVAAVSSGGDRGGGEFESMKVSPARK